MQSPSLDAVARNLIWRLEAASEGSRELDAEIALSVGNYRIEPMYGETRVTWFEGDKSASFIADTRKKPWWMSCDHIRPYTTSLDAAMSLIKPPGHPLYTWTVRARISTGHEFYEAEITVPSSEFRVIQRTPALALCIAALRARVSSVSHPSMAGSEE